jgi:hypothetical protein
MASKSHKKHKPNSLSSSLAAKDKPQTEPTHPNKTATPTPDSTTPLPPSPPQTPERPFYEIEPTAEPSQAILEALITPRLAPEEPVARPDEAPLHKIPKTSANGAPSKARWRIALWLAAIFSALLGDASWTPLPILDFASSSAPSPSEIFGQVTDEKGAPLSNATLQIGQIIGTSDVPASITLDDEGRFRLPNAPLGRFHCTASAPGYGTVDTEVVLTEKRPRVELFLRLPPGGFLAGQVVDARGDPVAKAFVGASFLGDETTPPQYALSDDKGNFTIENVARGAWVLFARTPLGLTSETREATAPTKEITLVIPNGSTIAGTFIDALQSAPLANARVRVGGSGLWPPREVTTDADGQYRFAGIPAGFYTIIATAKRADGVPLYAISEGVEVKANTLRDAVSLYANPSWELRGEVSDDTGRLLAGAELLLSEDPSFIVARRTFSDASGKFSFEGVPSGDHFVRVLSEDLPPSAPQKLLIAPAFREVISMKAPETKDAIDAASHAASAETPTSNVFVIELTVPKGQTILGAVVNEEGRPMSGAYVLLRDPRTGEIIGDPAPRRALARWEAEYFGASSSNGDSSRFVTGNDGRFAIFGVREGDVVVVAQLAGYPVSSSLCVVGGACRVVLAESGEIKGRVIDERGFPIQNASMRAAPSQNATFQVLYAEVASDGTFRLAPIGDAVDIRVRAPGYAPQTVKQVSATDDLEIVLTVNDAVLTGRVTDERGFPIERASIEAKLEEFSGQTVTAPDGTFSFSEVPRGEVQLKISRAGFAPLQMTGQGEDLDITLSEGATLSGLVIDENNAAVYFAQVELVYSDGTTIGTFSADGSFLLSELPPGKATLKSTVSGYVTTQQVVTLKQGATLEVEVVMRQSGVLRGKILLQEGGNASQAKVRIIDATGQKQETTCGKDGSFFFSAASPGRWSLLAQKGTQGAKETNLEVIADDTTRVTITLQEGVVAIEEEPKGFALLGATFTRQNNRYVVVSIEADSIADVSDLFAGDTIESIDGVAANSLSQEQFIAKLKTATQLFVTSREGELQEVELRR